MAKFDQRYQTVNYQYNGDNINFGKVDSKEKYIENLQALSNELARAKIEGALTDKRATEVDKQIGSAIRVVEEGQPNKKQLMEHLSEAAKMAKDVNGLASAIRDAFEVAKSFF